MRRVRRHCYNSTVRLSLTNQPSGHTLAGVMRSAIGAIYDDVPLIRGCIFALLLFCALASACVCVAQIMGIPPSASSNQQSETKVLSLDDVVRMSKAGLSDDIIVQQIRKRPQPFDLTPDQLIELKSAHVSDSVIRAMTESAATQKTAPAGIMLPKHCRGIDPQLLQKARRRRPRSSISRWFSVRQR